MRDKRETGRCALELLEEALVASLDFVEVRRRQVERHIVWVSHDDTQQVKFQVKLRGVAGTFGGGVVNSKLQTK
jgi:hypothetical protein